MNPKALFDFFRRSDHLESCRCTECMLCIIFSKLYANPKLYMEIILHATVTTLLLEAAQTNRGDGNEKTEMNIRQHLLYDL